MYRATHAHRYANWVTMRWISVYSRVYVSNFEATYHIVLASTSSPPFFPTSSSIVPSTDVVRYAFSFFLWCHVFLCQLATLKGSTIYMTNIVLWSNPHTVNLIHMFIWCLGSRVLLAFPFCKKICAVIEKGSIHSFSTFSDKNPHLIYVGQGAFINYPLVYIFASYD